MEEDLVEKLKFKLCVLGDASVGKTSLIHHFCEGFFRESYLATIGINIAAANSPSNIATNIHTIIDVLNFMSGVARRIS